MSSWRSCVMNTHSLRSITPLLRAFPYARCGCFPALFVSLVGVLFSACVKPVAAARAVATRPQRHSDRRCVQERYTSLHISSSFYELGTCHERPQGVPWT